jgi:hypothetical protein
MVSISNLLWTDPYLQLQSRYTVVVIGSATAAKYLLDLAPQPA